jgi:hypothetical protein
MGVITARLERYVDSAAVMTHLGTFGKNFTRFKCRGSADSADSSCEQ